MTLCGTSTSTRSASSDAPLMSGVPGATASPTCTCRCVTTPAYGARISVYDTPSRADSSPARAATSRATAASRPALASSSVALATTRRWYMSFDALVARLRLGLARLRLVQRRLGLGEAGGLLGAADAQDHARRPARDR